MKKKILSIALAAAVVLALVLIVMGAFAAADEDAVIAKEDEVSAAKIEDEASSWAVEGIKSALGKGFVPDDIQRITRR